MNNSLKNVFIGLGIIFFVFTISGLIINHDIASFLINVSTEILGIVITVFIIDRIIQNHEVQMKKNLLLLRMSSNNNETAKEALNELRLNGWVKDGSLNGVSLFKANLSDANLYEAIMTDANLSFAIFERAYLCNAKLTNSTIYFTSFRNAEMRGADLTGMRDPSLYFYEFSEVIEVEHRTFVNAFSLRNARMPDGTIYDGRYRLVGDIDSFHGIISSPNNSIEYSTEDSIEETDENWATFYGVSVEKYRQGQLWAEKNLEKEKMYAPPPKGYNFTRDEEGSLYKKAG